MNSVIITGPTGEVGLSLVDELLKNNIEIYAIVRPNSKRVSRLPRNPKLHIIENNLDDLGRLNNIIHVKCDVFYHLGWDFSRAHNDIEKQYKNIAYSLDALKVAKELGCTTFVGAGSQAEYGVVNGIISPDTPVHPQTAYGMAKLAAGQMTRLLAHQLGIKHIWPRIISIYGPGDAESTMIISTIRKLLNGEKPSLTLGEQQWDFLYSKDCARAMRLIAENGKDGAVYCIGQGKMQPLKSYMEALRDQINPNLELGLGEIPYKDNQVMKLDIDTSSLFEDTGFTPAYTFEEGIRETIDWCINNPPVLKPEERSIQ